MIDCGLRINQPEVSAAAADRPISDGSAMDQNAEKVAQLFAGLDTLLQQGKSLRTELESFSEKEAKRGAELAAISEADKKNAALLAQLVENIEKTGEATRTLQKLNQELIENSQKKTALLLGFCKVFEFVRDKFFRNGSPDRAQGPNIEMAQRLPIIEEIEESESTGTVDPLPRKPSIFNQIGGSFFSHFGK